MKALSLAAAAVVAAFAVAAGASAGPAKESPGRGEFTVHVIEHATTDAVADIAPTGDSVGDLLTFANELFDRTNTKHSGHDQGYCVRVVAGLSWECFWTAFLAGGQLTVEGPFIDTRSGSKLAVTGGTGVYADARGWMQLRSRKGGTEFDFIYHLKRAG
jgi:hypothetical protein